MNEPSFIDECARTDRPLQVLLLEDDPLDAELIQARLVEAGMPCLMKRVQTEVEFKAALENECPDVILADYLLPEFDGTTALGYVTANCPDVPFLFVSGMIGEEPVIESLRNGATDYVLKRRLDRLGPAVRRAVLESRERAERKRLEKELQRRVDQLAEIDRRKNQFLAVLSHELRNPLAPIRYALPLLQTACRNDPESAEACAVVERQVGHLSHLVDDLLDVFRIIHRQVRIQKKTLNLADLLRQTVADRKSAIEEAGQTIELHLPDQPILVDGDATRLYQVVSNLLINAVKFNTRGGRIDIRLTFLEGTRRAVVSVRDNGTGIEAEMLPFVFDMFAQADDSLTRKQGGLGLGLALVKGFVEKHGGAVSVSSPGTGHGTEVAFWLPLSANRQETSSFKPLPPVARRLDILIVEDNPDAARSLQMLLRRAGHEVRVAQDGPTGIAAARQSCPDVVLCDLGLPEMDGFEVGRVLRSDPVTASARLIAVSGHGQEEDRRHSEEAGFDLHLTKPVDPKDLQRLLAVLKLGRD